MAPATRVETFALTCWTPHTHKTHRSSRLAAPPTSNHARACALTRDIGGGAWSSVSPLATVDARGRIPGPDRISGRRCGRRRRRWR